MNSPLGPGSCDTLNYCTSAFDIIFSDDGDIMKHDIIVFMSTADLYTSNLMRYDKEAYYSTNRAFPYYANTLGSYIQTSLLPSNMKSTVL